MYILFSETAVMGAAIFGTVYGLIRCRSGKMPLYALMSVMGLLCMALGSFHTVIRVMTSVPVEGVFQTGTLGTVGAFMFFFSSNYGQIDLLVDDRSAANRKYRLTAGALSALLLVSSILAVRGSAEAGEVFGYILCSLSVSMAAYFNIKHLIIPDIEGGIVSCLRGHNALILCMGLMCTVKNAALSRDGYFFCALSAIPQCILTAACFPVLERGVRRWSE